jgi:hypothetical protein
LVPDELPDGVLGQLLNLLVPEDQRTVDAPLMRALFKVACMDHEIDATKRLVNRKKDKDPVLEELRDLVRRINNLSDEAKLRLGATACQHFRSAISAIDAILATNCDASSRAAHPKGRPWEQLTTAFDHFVLNLYALKEVRGWCVSITPDLGTGRLVEFLSLAEPYLPPRFVPRCPNWKGLQGIGTGLRKIAKSEEGWPRELVEDLRRHSSP